MMISIVITVINALATVMMMTIAAVTGPMIPMQQHVVTRSVLATVLYHR